MTWSSPHLAAWCAALHAGDVAIAPAEGMYGYSADPFNPAALESLLAHKRRAGGKGLIVLVGTLSQLDRLCPPLPPACQQAVATHWQSGQPPTTLILPALPTLPPLLTGDFGTLAIRLPSVSYMQEYLNAYGGPLVSTSCNVSGQPPATSAGQLPVGIPALTLAEPLSGAPSRIFNPQTGQWLR